MIRESSIERRVCDWAREHGFIVLKLSSPNAKGQPDRELLRDGKAAFIEFKAPGKRPTALQEKWLADLRGAGFWAESFDSAPAAIRWLREVFNIS